MSNGKAPRRVRVAVSVADIRKEPAHEAEMTTQALLGWPLAVLETADEGRWHRVRLPDDYTGWIRAWLVTPDPTGWPGPRVAEVDVPLTWLRREPDAEAEPVSDLLLGARLAVLPGRAPGWLLLGLPDGRAGWLARTDLLRGGPIGATAARRPPTVARVLATARRCMGVPYVWGGRSPKGLDCSGLTQMALELHDLAIPRDAKDQRRHLEKLAHPIDNPLEAPPGSLLFFGKTRDRATHVGFATGMGGMLHAQGRVREDSLNSDNPMFRKDLMDLFQVACRVPGLKGRT